MAPKEATAWNGLNEESKKTGTDLKLSHLLFLLSCLPH